MRIFKVKTFNLIMWGSSLGYWDFWSVCRDNEYFVRRRSFSFLSSKTFPLRPFQGSVLLRHYRSAHIHKHNEGQRMRKYRSGKAEIKKADRLEEVEACTYWARRGRERGPPSRNPQRSARCWTWWRLQRRQHSDQTPAWKAPRESTQGVDQTLETERSRRET